MDPVKWNKKTNAKEKRFLEMIESNKEQFYRIAYSYMKNEHDALEVIQESICKAYENLSQLRVTAFMKTWFIRILINTANGMLKQSQKLKPYATMEEGFYEEESIRQSEDALDLMTSLDQLNENEKAIVLLRFFEDYKLEDVSKAMGLPLNTTKTTLYRALKKMRIQLEEGPSHE